ncbi:FAD binding domain-containing protein [Achromobacter sp. GG226]|uniref:FAD binding domain-containing protein n=1 Tax=Verticiella alkaliphila TaxID=2779529 RepID=UPI001C0BB837|nr:FAD binding domain-containing protein [Verticiella sp. GG226]MBU4611718.1 FAD binding domain-containing protein [Verticiella sp. GG226]
MKAPLYDLDRAASLDEAVTLLARDAFFKPIAGGQSLGAMLNLRLARPERLIDLDALPALREAHLTDGGLVLGAMVTHAALEDGRVPDVTHGMLAQVARGIAYRAVRNRGTVGGSLCHADPAADWVSAMAAMGATCVLRGAQGERHVPASAFLRSAFEPDVEPAEVLTAVRIPAFGAGARWGYRKHCRKTGEFAMAIVAGLHDPQRGIERLVFGALDGAPQVIEGAGLLAGLARATARQDLIASAGLATPVDRAALHLDLLGSVLTDLGVAHED